MLGPEEIDRILAERGLEPRRSLGQNFVSDPLVIDRLVELSGVGAGSDVLEVGPGLGSLTSGLAGSGARVLALEKDQGLCEVLRDVLVTQGLDPLVRIRHGDALTVDLDELLSVRGGPADPAVEARAWSMVANLPYNVAVPIILRILSEAPSVGPMFVMVQNEVAERLCALPGGRTIGLPTLRLNWYATARIVMTVPPEAFVPVPRVESAVVAIHRTQPPHCDTAAGPVFDLAHRAYGQRRKMLRSSLRGLDADTFADAGVDPTSRPEELSVQQWADLADTHRRHRS